MKTIDQQEQVTIQNSFTLPFAVVGGRKMVTDEKAPITLRLKAKVLAGYHGKYTITIGDGGWGVMSIHNAGASASIPAERIYELNTGLHNGPVSEEDYTDITISPEKNWLAPGQQCGTINLGIGLQGLYTKHNSPSNLSGFLIGIQRPQ